jgi:UDP-N-acetylglucosamine transferase subunit ALG13
MYGFDSSRNILTINSGSLMYNSLYSYLFVMETSYLNSVYGQAVLIQVGNSSTLPVATLKYL